MKKILYLSIIIFVAKIGSISAQTTPGPAQLKLLDSLCNGLGRINLSEIKTKKAASDAFMNCFTNYSDQLLDVAKEQNIEVTDQAGMHNLGIEIGKNLMKQKCAVFMKLAVKMAKDDDSEQPALQSVAGTFKRIDTKGFNYIVIADRNGAEKSYIWLRQFPGSEKFMGLAAAKLTGKKIDITWQEMEVYLPQAKGYYAVKEITGITVL
jgi:hypothetical protein